MNVYIEVSVGAMEIQRKGALELGSWNITYDRCSLYRF